MAQQYDNEKRIALFPNDKGGNEKRPDYRGKLTLNGVDYKVSIWNRTGQKGPYLSGQIEADAGAQKPSVPSQPVRSPYEESAPF